MIHQKAPRPTVEWNFIPDLTNIHRCNVNAATDFIRLKFTKKKNDIHYGIEKARCSLSEKRNGIKIYEFCKKARF
jgi:hypothetical protein